MICEKCEALNALIDGYRRERDEARLELAGLPAWQYACEQSRRDLAHAEAEVDRLRKDITDAYRRGAEEMRKACWEVPYCACGRQLTECDGSRAGCLGSTGKIKDKDKP